MSTNYKEKYLKYKKKYLSMRNKIEQYGSASAVFDNKTLKKAVNLWMSNRNEAIRLYGDINTWDVSQVTNMNNLFYYHINFNDDISNWNVINVTDMSNMFKNAYSFNQPIGRWDVRNVTDMTGMFEDARVFNQPIGRWNVEKVTKMGSMFSGASAFNQPLEQWNVGNVTDMQKMFFGASAFNQPLERWNVDNVTYNAFMFLNATSFLLRYPNAKKNPKSVFTSSESTSSANDKEELSQYEIRESSNKFQKNTFRILGPSNFAYFKNLSNREILLFGETHIPIPDKRPHDILSWDFIKNLIKENSNSCVDVFMESEFKIVSDESESVSNNIAERNLYDIKLPNGAIEYNADIESYLELVINTVKKITLVSTPSNKVDINNIANLSPNLKKDVGVFISNQLAFTIIDKYCCSSIYHIEYGRNLFKNIIKDPVLSNLRYHRWDLTIIEDKVKIYMTGSSSYSTLFEICLQLLQNGSIDKNKFIDLILNEPLDGYDRTFVIENKLTQFGNDPYFMKTSQLKRISNPISLFFDAINSGISNIDEYFPAIIFSKEQCIKFANMFLGRIPFNEEEIKKFYESIFFPFLDNQHLFDIMKQNKDNYISLALLDKIAKKTKKQIDKLSNFVDNVDELIDQFILSFTWDNDLSRNKVNEWETFFINLRVIQTDIYAFARMFGDFKIKEHKCDKYGQMKKIIYYGGHQHTENIIKLIKLFFNNDPDELGRNQMNIRQGFVDVPKLDYFDIDYNKLVPKI